VFGTGNLKMDTGFYGSIHSWIQMAALGIELLSVTIIAAAMVFGTVRYIARGFGIASYTQYKQILERALLLALNILVAADIIRTVALEPTIWNLIGLGLLVVISYFPQLVSVCGVGGTLALGRASRRHAPTEIVSDTCSMRPGLGACNQG
jgi:uncharacterized membrane protein